MALFGAIIGGLAGAASSLLGNSALKAAKPQPIQLGDFKEAFPEYLAQAGYLPNIAELLGGAATQDNDRYVKSLEAYFPGITKAIKTQGEQALAYQQGYISPDQQIADRRKAAQKAYQGGYALSPFAQDQQDVTTARRALSNTEVGNQLAQQTQALSASLAPSLVDVSKTLLNPQDLLKRDDAMAYYNQDLSNQTRAINAGIDLGNQRLVGNSLAQGLGGIGGMLSGATPGGSSGWNALWGANTPGISGALQRSLSSTGAGLFDFVSMFSGPGPTG